jgi:hypothetical protein
MEFYSKGKRTNLSDTTQLAALVREINMSDANNRDHYRHEFIWREIRCSKAWIAWRWMERQVWCKEQWNVFAYEYLQRREEYNISRSNNTTLFHYQENVCAKSLKMATVVTVGSKLVTFVWSKRTKHRQFRDLFGDTESESEDVYAIRKVVGWVVVRCLTHVWLAEAQLLLKMKRKPFYQRCDHDRMCDFAFCTHITQCVNGLNINLQGANRRVTEIFDKITESRGSRDCGNPSTIKKMSYILNLRMEKRITLKTSSFNKSTTPIFKLYLNMRP